jgi:hypothetical protein
MRCSANQPHGDADLLKIFPTAIGGHGRNLEAGGRGQAGAIAE